MTERTPDGTSVAMAKTVLRPYQREAIAAVIRARQRGVRRMVVCLPTGAGKTVIFAELCRLARRPVLVLAHRRELVEQAREKIARALDDAGVVAVEQGATTAPADAHVVVASIRSLHDDRLARVLADRDFGLVVYDECHHAVADGNRRVLEGLGAFREDWTGTLLGVTATAVRADRRGLDEIFDTIVYRRTVSEMVADGYLVPLRGYRIATAEDLTTLRAGAGDFVVDELAEKVDVTARNALVARSIQELARDRRTIAFCVTVQHARRLARALNAIGVATGIVHGAMDPDRRALTLADFRAGRLSAVTNVGVLTEGFDDPGVSCIAMARPTRSDGLYAQCVGRGTRLAPGKRDCLVLDFVDLTDLSLATLPTLAGLPPDVDLEGASVDEAERIVNQIWDERPGFEIEPGTITLGEIQRRARAFDPLDLTVPEEIMAISGFRWESLGANGLALHVAWGKKGLVEILVLMHSTRGKRWRVLVGDKEMARFSRLEEAVEAVDYEVSRRGRTAVASARPEAPWRRGPVPAAIAARLAAVNQSAANHGDALRVLAYTQHGPRRGRTGWSLPTSK